MVKGSTVYSYAQLEQRLEASRDGQVKLAHNTIAHKISDTQIGIRLYYTDVVVVNADNTYSLFSKGYSTSTTKDRMNGFSPAKIITKQFSFYILRDPTQRALKHNLVPFYEGITVDKHGTYIQLVF
jgi:hypothetical protein